MTPTAATTRTLALATEGRRFVFRYGSGRENEVMDHIWRLAEQGRCGLDWVDAATLCFQAACQAASQGRDLNANALETRR